MNCLKTSQCTALLLLLFASASMSCHHNAAAAAPQPTPTPVAASPVPAAAPTISIRSDRAALTRGQSATLSITSQNATTVTIEPGLGNVPLNGSRLVTPTSSVTFVATAFGPGGSAGDSVRVTVNDPPPPAATPIRSVAPAAPSAALTLDQQFQKAMQAIQFDYDKADIRPDQIGKLQTVAAFVKQNPGLRITIEGHCDERGSEEYNLALGDRRANAIKQYLTSMGIAESTLKTISYGEEKPFCHEQTEVCFERNRRGVFTRTS